MTRYEKNIYNSSKLPFFSIITPVFNSEKYLNDYFCSLMEQSFINFEVIIIDDGSKDNSLTIIKDHQKKLANLKLIQQSNSKQVIARNKALNIATGDYILFIDSDDLLTSSKTLEYLYNHLIK